MSLLRVAALLVMCGIALSAVGKSGTPQNSATKPAAKQDDIPKSIAESVGGTLQFAEGNFLGLAEAMPENKYSYVPAVGNFDGVRSFGESRGERTIDTCLEPGPGPFLQRCSRLRSQVGCLESLASAVHRRLLLSK